jgi:hypothetical protein
VKAESFMPSYSVTAWEALSAGDVLRFWLGSYSGDSITQSLSNSQINLGRDTSDYQLWQSFQTVNGWLLSSISLWLFRSGSPTWDLSIEVYSDTGATLVGVSTNTVDASTLTTSSSWSEYTFNFGTLLDASTTYYFKLVSSNTSTNSSNFVRARFYTSTSYGGWDAYQINSSNTWNVIAWDDLKFSLTVSAVSETSTKAYKASAWTLSAASVIWIARTSASADASVQVDVLINSEQSSLTVWSDYYVSNTAWEVSTTPWSTSKKIWTAVTATTLIISL